MSQEQIQIPKGWELKKLGDVLDVLSGHAFKSEFFSKTEGIPLIRIRDLDKKETAVFYNKEDYDKKFIVNEDDYLISMDGDFKIYEWKGKEALLNQRVCKLYNFSNKNVFPKFIFYAIQDHLGKIQQNTAYTTVKHISSSQIEAIKLPFPPLPIQKKIVQKLDDILGQLEEKKKQILELVDKNSENLETLTEQFQGELITKHFNSPQVLDNSEIKRLDEVCTINPSKQEIKDLDDKTQVSFIPMKLVDDKKGEITTMEIRNLGDVKGGYTYFKENDVIFAKITPCMQNGKCAIGLDLKNGIAFGSTEFHVFRVNEDVLPEWIYYFLRQYKLRKHAEKNMTGTAGQKRVPKEFLAAYKIPIPPKSIQKDMIKKIKESSSHIHSDVKILNSIRDSHQNLLQQLDNSQSSILDTAFSGKLLK